MNPDEVKGLITKLLLAGLTALAVRLHSTLDAESLTPFAVDAADAIVGGYMLWRQTNMKLVPEAAAVVPPGAIVVSGPTAAPVVVAAQKVADLPPSASPAAIETAKSAAVMAVADHQP